MNECLVISFVSLNGLNRMGAIFLLPFSEQLKNNEKNNNKRVYVGQM